MRSNFVNGIIAGLIAGAVFGLMMTVMSTPDGNPMMVMVAKVVGSESIAVGWIYHLFNSAVIGGLFGFLLGSRAAGYSGGLLWGAIWGVVWWILGALILMPIFLGMSAFAPLMMEPMRMIAVSSLVGHVVFGLILGAAFVFLSHKAPVVAEGT